ncbi:MAG: nucleotide exchange factor GrpE [Pseudomonadales bacterium]|jgi:molecular chaperone GrpE|nr:nucleotide exchange factor GrpE [Pseudomonadales bacterium]
MADDPQRREEGAEAGQPDAHATAEASARQYEEVAGASSGEVDEDAPAPGDPVSEALEAARQEAASFKDLALRAQAEAENVRRRAARDVENAHKFALEKFAAQLLPVVDSLEKSVDAVSGEQAAEGFAAIREGIQLSHRLFLDTLAKVGIEQVDPVGEPFNPELHEAMTMIDVPSAEPNSVVDVLAKGYTLNGRLLRAAMVVVARAPG